MSLFIEPLRFLSLKPRRRILHSTPCCWRTTALHHTDLHWAFHQSEPSWSQTGTTPRQNTHLQNNFKFCLKEQKRIKTCEDKSKTIPKHLNKSENNDLDLHLTSFLPPWYLAAVFILTQTEIPADQRTVTYWMTGEILKNRGCSGKHPASSSVIPVTVWLVWIKSYDHTYTLQLHALLKIAPTRSPKRQPGWQQHRSVFLWATAYHK